jgi:cytochrome c oxidase subunit 3
MSDSTTAPTGDAHEGHDPFLAHHFDSQQQQFDAGKLGMWLFLVTEILFFSGLFVAYAVYRSNHPEVFIDAHKYLDKTLGALNTIVLLFSSLTMAWAVRCAQLRQRTGLIWCLTITLACASLFLGVKAVEYTHKWAMGLFWGASFAPQEHTGEHGISWALVTLCAPAAAGLVLFGLWALVSHLKGRRNKLILAVGLTITSLAFFVGVGIGQAVPAVQERLFPSGEHASHATSHGEADGPEEEAIAPAADAPTEGPLVISDPLTEEGQSLVSVFFSIYYSMTGIHAIHILAGMGVIVWILWRSIQDHFNERYYGPVDYTGLYWHLVDLIWIYLFPLLYLIH